MRLATAELLRACSTATSNNVWLKNPLRCAIITVAHLLFWGDLVKNKIKKYIYPPIFSAGFIAFWVAVVLIINTTATGDEGYGGLGIAMLILFAWLILALPIYCIRYSKIIVDEKLKFVFSVYNSLLIIASHVLPFNLQGELTIIIYFVLWVLFWNFFPIVWRLLSRKYEEKHAENTTQL